MAGRWRKIKMAKKVFRMGIGYHEWPCGCRLWLTGFVPRDQIMEHDSEVFGKAIVCATTKLAKPKPLTGLGATASLRDTFIGVGAELTS